MDVSPEADGGLAAVLAGPVLEAAPRLLGCVLRHGDVAVRLTEVEAYAGLDDPGSHAFRGPTTRNRVMFGPAGRLYVYLIYGMHHCANVVTGADGHASAVLLRAGEVVEGVDVARERRGGAADRDLARGPARLCVALGITPGEYGADLLTGGASSPVLEQGQPVPADRVATGPRVGLRAAADLPWRYWVARDLTVSAYRPAAPRRRRGSAT